MLALNPLIKSYLLTQPEYGMGYQFGEVVLNTKQTQQGIFLNGTYFLPKSELAGLSSASQILEQVRCITTKSALSVESVKLQPRPAASLRKVVRIHSVSAANSKTASAKEADITFTISSEVFKRFSAYVDDFRVTARGALVPGTYATTAEDAQNVSTGKEAIARYALENKTPANKVFTIAPHGGTRVQRGTVQPAFYEPGGGVEVIFVDGTQDFTVTGPEIIPEG